MTDRDLPTPVPPELADAHDDLVDEAVQLARNALPAARAAELRDRMDRDPIYRAVVQPILAAHEVAPDTERDAAAAWGEFRRRSGLSGLTPDDGDLAEFERRVRLRDRTAVRRLIKVAAVVVGLLALPPVAMVYMELRYFTTVKTASNITSVVHLPDGSTARLEAGSSARYMKDMTSGRGRLRREVDLTGAADFTVASLANEPFRVRTQSALVVAVGTRFRVEEQGAITVVRVYEGRVTVQARDDNGDPAGASLALAAGYSARAVGSHVILDLQRVPQPQPKENP